MVCKSQDPSSTSAQLDITRQSYIDHFCDCIVAVWVLNEVNHVFSHLLEELLGLVLAPSARDELLDYAEAVGVFGKLDEVREHLIKDELALGLLEALHHLLNHVRSLRVLSESDYIPSQRVFNEVFLLWQVDELEHCLDRVSAFPVAANLDELGLD